MKVQELRLNNLIEVKICTNKNQFVTGVTNDSINTTDADNLNLSDIKPIKLTDKWLIDFGFTKIEWDNNNSFRKMVGNNDYTIVFYSNCVCEIGGIITKEIEFVHQLQNLYYALTGVELSVS